jgi:hypothetical protein
LQLQRRASAVDAQAVQGERKNTPMDVVVRMRKQVDEIVAQLMIIAQLQEHDKLHVAPSSDGSSRPTLHIQEWSATRWLRRMFNGDGVDRTKDAMRDLYEDLFLSADMLMSLVDASVVMVADKKALCSLENTVYLDYRNMLDQLTMWLQRTIPKLQLLNNSTYDGKETTFALLAEKAQQKWVRLDAHCAQLSQAYSRLAIQPPLAADTAKGAARPLVNPSGPSNPSKPDEEEPSADANLSPDDA